ncbi:MAG: hypothetical protein A2W97_03970 [Bacteroidetes bacterium GWE2_40_63]|jgi:putative MATE family efflux protein|nr:MAG: hypothetical protein A2W95_03365 [Bacteroidetes bacterium GWA2_40_14]OFX58102.1 MAG: hypothetical protein A2W84_09040 [Bacteroidetes bacterium GWC2_40_13]OFX72740.1 MAG: hypothetical protein A2W96_18550 [Bacteroidetes bacterium GWD2_40_43]OFX91370.1 MAG: hypothetical protein A2W97_03970 [Bacteroidetes bacterium GWE2_40_63]OFY19439.1 MAG: hypothetical protein A2W88_01850 [Bacteroidetes bacterium GWF2_40_13]OFZ25658.1 MAG: hypothetical protein A2437_12255 [Bacteroidetes bacterium RIFOXYC
MIGETYSYKNIWRIAYPIIIGNLAQDLLTVVDTAFVGQLGEIPLAAAAIGSIFYLAIVMLGWGFALGVQILIARKLGEGNLKDIQKIVNHSFLVLLLLTSSIFIALHFYSHQLFGSMLQSADVTRESLKFLDIRIYGIFAAFMNMNFRAFYIGIAKTKIISITTVIMALVNFVLDYFLIFGKGPFPNMGIEGAALASVIAEFVALFIFIYYTGQNAESKKLIGVGKPSFEVPLFKTIFRISTPTMLQHFVSFSAWFIFFLFVEKMGETPLAISNIIRSIYLLILVPIFGFASATNTLVSYSIGKGESTWMVPIIKKALGLSFVFIGVLASITLLFSTEILHLYTSDDIIIEKALPALYVILAASFTLAFGIILFQAVAGTGRTNISLVIEIVVICFYLSGVYALTHFGNTRIEVVWLLEFLYGLGLGITSILYLKAVPIKIFKGTKNQ